MGERTTVGRVIVGVGGLLLIVSLFLKWSGSLPVDLSASPADLGNGIPSVTQDSLNDALDGLGGVVQGASASGFGLLGWVGYLFFFFGLVALLPLVLDLAGFELELSVPQYLITLICGLLTLGGLIMLFATGEQLKFGVWIAAVAAVLITLGSFQQVEDEADAADSNDASQSAQSTAQAAPQKEDLSDAVS